jgi:hypothetical protein
VATVQRFFDDKRGYVRWTIIPEQWWIDPRVVPTVEEALNWTVRFT